MRKGVRACLLDVFFTTGFLASGEAQGEAAPVQDSTPAQGNKSVSQSVSEWPLPLSQGHELGLSSWFLWMVTTGICITEPGLDS